MQITLLAKSSSQPEPYPVTFNWNNNKLSVSCSCPAGEIGQLCKHKTAFLANDTNMLYDSKQKGQLDKIAAWVQSSSIPKLLLQLKEAELEKDNIIEKAKKEFSGLKHKLARLLSEGA